MGYLDKAGLSRAFTKLKALIDKKVDTHTWNAVSQGGTWSRICHVNCQSNVIGSSFFLNVRGTRSSVVFNTTFIVTASHSQQANIIQLQSTTYSPFKIRTLSDANGNCYIEIYDDAAGIASGTSQTLACTIIPITTGTVTKYTSFTSGATVPSGYAVAKTMTVTAENAIVADSFIGNLSGANAWVTTVHGSLDGNASTATRATKLAATAKGSATQPVYINSDGVPTATTYTLGKSVPSTAVFTDTTYSAATTSASGLMSATDKAKLNGIAEGANNYTLPNATGTTKGGVTIGSNITVSSGTISLTKANVTNALGYTPPTTNTTYGTGSTSSSGLTKLYTSTGTNTDGTMTQSAITTALSGKASSSHTHNYAGSSSAGGNATWANGATYANYSYNDKPITTGGSGTAYTASVSGLTLVAGASFVMVPHVVSASTAPTLNVNSLGAKTIRMRLSSSPGTTVSLPSAAWLTANKPVRMMYDGTYWLIDDFVRPDASALYGTVAGYGTSTPSTSTNKSIYALRDSSGNVTAVYINI